jgi:signal transduction histidine kinase/CheY-like chemotaxis protein
MPNCKCPIELMDTIFDGILIVDLNGTIIKINKQGENYLNKNVINKNIIEIFPQLTPNFNCADIKTCILTDCTGVYDIKINYTQCPIHQIILFNDHRSQTENTKNHITKNNHQFISFLSHEIRNPLQSILMANQMIKHINQNQKLNKYQEIIEKSSNEMRKIVNDVLDLNKIEIGELSIEDELIKPDELLQEIISSYQDIAHESKLMIEGSLDDHIQPFYSDYVRIIQILSNLVSNGIKYSNEGTIKLEIYEHDKTLNFKVTDTGIGIPEKDLDKLFKSRIKLQNKTSLKKKYQSDGIGLLISNKIAELLGGKIIVCSQENKGSSFTLNIPYRTDPLIHSSYIDNVEFNLHDITGEILIAEDSHSNLELVNDLINHFITKYSFKIKTHLTVNGIEALKIYQQRKDSIDLFILDINMDLLDGIQTCRIIKEIDPSRKVVALTGNIYIKNSEEKFKIFDEIMLKPCTETKLLNILLKYMKTKD